MNKMLNIGFLFFIMSVFMLYNATIYSEENPNYTTNLSIKALSCEAIWQQKSDYFCRQLYGLGGYLDPDLTNIYSTKDIPFSEIQTSLYWFYCLFLFFGIGILCRITTYYFTYFKAIAKSVFFPTKQ